MEEILETKSEDSNANISYIESHTSQALILQRQIDELVYQLYGLDSKEIQIIQE
ncbi:hypothetical protein [uncultured Helicobacter sp.]|nr:hypothetical protein [uncultured Helicobacter sp.]